MPAFDIEKIANNPQARVLIRLRAGSVIESFVTDSFTIDGSNDFNSLFESSKSAAAQGTLQKGAATIDTLVGTNLSQYAVKSLNQTRLFWTGSKKPTFTIPLKFIATKPGHDVRIPVGKLAEALYPTTSGDSILGSALLRAPLGYNPATGAGTINIEMGTWFKARKLVMLDASFNFSMEQTKISETLYVPLYCEVNLQVTPYQAITYQQFLSYLGLTIQDVKKIGLGIVK